MALNVADIAQLDEEELHALCEGTLLVIGHLVREVSQHLPRTGEDDPVARGLRLGRIVTEHLGPDAMQVMLLGDLLELLRGSAIVSDGLATLCEREERPNGAVLMRLAAAEARMIVGDTAHSPIHVDQETGPAPPVEAPPMKRRGRFMRDSD